MRSPLQARRAAPWACWLVAAASIIGWPLAAASTYYVATNGLDTATGLSTNTPWKTIGHAASTMRDGDKVLIRGGTYRETVNAGYSGSSANSRITYAAYPGERPIITGADIYSSWTWDTNAIPHAWKTPWSISLPSSVGDGKTDALVARREMIIFNGQVLTAVGTRAELVNGTFWASGADTSPDAIYALFPGGASPTNNTVEAATRNHCFNSSGKNYLAVTGLTFRYACNAYHDLMVNMTGSGHLFSSNVVEWANAGGLYSAASSSFFSNNIVQNNGQLGFSGAGSSTVWDHNQSNGNNWKGYDANWEGGGGKWCFTYNSTISHHVAFDNGGPGIWLDMTNVNISIEECLCYSNASWGIKVEIDSHNCTVKNCIVFGSVFNPPYDPYCGGGIVVLSGLNCSVVNNTVFGCAGDGICVYDDNRELGNPKGTNKVYNNLVAFNATGGGTKTYQGHQIEIQGQSTADEQSHSLNGNLYYSAGVGTTFAFASTSTSSFSTWQSKNGGEDANSTNGIDPQLADRTVYSGFNLTASSPARGLGVTPPVPVTTDFYGNPRPDTGADAGAVQYIAPPPPPLSFTQQPLPLYRFIGGNAAFSATVTGLPPASLQWYFNNAPLAGATNSTLLLSNLTSLQAGNYWLLASNANCVTSSLPAQLSIGNPGAYTAAVLATGPAAYWRLNESNGPTAYDCLSTNNGLASANVIFGVAGGLTSETNAACHFDASTSGDIDVNYNPAVNGSAYTFECWARLTGPSNVTACVLASRNAPTTQGYFVQVSSNGVWQFCSGTGMTIWHTLNGPAVVPGQWTHLAGTYSGSTKTFYVNGQQVATAGVQFTTNSSACLRLGAGATEGSGSDFFSGDLNEVAIYGYALSATQIQAHFLAAFPPVQPVGFSGQPSPMQRFVGGNAFFAAAVTGSPPVSLQWNLNGTPVFGATNSTLLLTNLTSDQAGNYSLVASNRSSVVTSLPAPLSIWTPGPYASAVLAAAPAAYWRLNESNGPTVFDSVSTNNGIASGDVAFGVSDGLLNESGTGCHFEAGTSDKVDFFYNPALNSSAFSFECWARVTGPSNVTACVLASRNAPTTQGYFVQASSNNVWQFCSGTGMTIWHTLNGPAVVPGQWTHLAGTYSGTSKSFYVNGQQVASASVQFVPNPSAPLRLGAGATEGSGNNFLSGDVDEAVIYGYGLSAAQVQAHYQAALSSQILHIAQTSGGVQLTWAGGTLQAADSLNSPWNVVTNAVSPWILAPATNQQFFRIRIP